MCQMLWVQQWAQQKQCPSLPLGGITFYFGEREHTHTYSIRWLVGMQNGIATLENTSAVSYKIKHALPIWPWNLTRMHLPRGMKVLLTQKPTCKCWFIVTEHCRQPSPLLGGWISTPRGQADTQDLKGFEWCDGFYYMSTWVGHKVLR